MARHVLLASLATICLSGGLPDATHAAETAGHDWQWRAGVKAWANQWDSWSINRVQIGGNVLQIVDAVSSDDRVAFIPFISIQQGNWSFTASAMSKTRYALSNAAERIDGSRREFDVNAGWSMAPGITLTAGYKSLTQDAGGHFTWRGPVLGVSGTAPLSAGWALYGIVGLGRLSLKLPNTDAQGQDTLQAGYALSETGLAYTFKPGSLTLALGYRSQTVRSRDYALSSQPSGGGATSVYGHGTLRDTTQGLTISLLGSF